MSRLQEYRRRVGATGVRIPGAVRVATPPRETGGAAGEIAAAVDGALGMAGRMLAREHVLDSQTRLEESLLAARREFSEWQAAYVAEHRGSNALTAGSVFRDKFAEIAERRLQEFEGAENEVFRRQLGGRLAAEGVRAAEQGMTYAARERTRWEGSVLAGQRAQLLADAEREPHDSAWLGMQMEGYRRALEARGLDATADMLELERAVQLHRGLGMVRRGELEDAAALAAGMGGSSGQHGAAAGEQMPHAGGKGNAGGRGKAGSVADGGSAGAAGSMTDAGGMAETGNGEAMTAEAARLREAVEAAQRSRAGRLRVVSGGFDEAAAAGVAGGDFSAALRLVEEVTALDAGEGEKLRTRLEARQTVWDAMQLHGDRPLLEQGDAALKALEAGRRTPGSVGDTAGSRAEGRTGKTALREALRGEAASVIRQRLQIFRDDPAAFAAAAQPELLPEGLDLRERTRRLLEVQQTLGRGMKVQPRILTRAQAAELGRTFAESEPQSRLHLLTEMHKGYGKYFAAAATEAGLSAPVVALGATLERMPPSRAAVLLSAATAQEKDIPGVDKDARAAARDTVAGLHFMQQLAAISRRFPGNEGVRAVAASWERMLTNAALMGVEPDEATRHFDIIVASDPDERRGGHILFVPEGSLPGGWDADDLAEAAERAREVVQKRLTDMVLPKKGASPQQRQEVERAARHVAETGVWVSALDGSSVQLVDGIGGQPEVYPDGTPVSFTLDELLPPAADAPNRRGVPRLQGVLTLS